MRSEDANKDELIAACQSFGEALKIESDPDGALAEIPQHRPGLNKDEIGAFVFFAGPCGTVSPYTCGPKRR